jgi:hypothetical protein
MNRTFIALLLLGIAVVFPAQSWASTNQVTVTVNGTSGPWLWVNGGLNTAFQFGYDNQKAPTVVSAANGLPFTAGDVLLVQYVSGLVDEGGDWPANDANGASFWIASPITTGELSMPSLYFNSADYPAFAAELTGTFAVNTGAIVGTPFKVGNFRYLAIPAGATQLQLGNIDDNYSDDSGSWEIMITEINAGPPLQVYINPAVAISWTSDPTHVYQVQWASRIDTNTWVNLGVSVTGNGTTNTVYDPVGIGNRFYRVEIVQ